MTTATSAALHTDVALASLHRVRTAVCAAGVRHQLRRRGHGAHRPDRAPRAADRDLHARHRAAAGARRYALIDRVRAALRRCPSTSTSRDHARARGASCATTASTRSTTASSCARPAARSARSSRCARALAGKRRLDHRPAPRAVGDAQRAAARGVRRGARPAEVQPAGRLDRGRRLGTTSARIDVPVQRAARPGLSEHRLRALHARRRSRARTSAPAAGGGSSAEHKECGLHRRPLDVARPRRPRGATWHERCSLSATDRRTGAGARRRHVPPMPITSTGSSRRPSTSCARSPASARNPALLFSGGKDSLVLLRLAREGVPSRARSRSRCCTSTPATISRR